MTYKKWDAQQKDIADLDAIWGDAATKALREAATDNDFRAVAALYSEEGSILWPGFDPGYGRQEIAAGWKKANGSFSNSALKFTPVCIEIMGNLATDLGIVEFTDPKGGLTLAKYLVVWRREEGSWKVYYDCWNQNPDPPQK